MKIIDKNNTHIEDTVEIGEGTIIYPNVIIEGKTKIGKNCTILMNTYIKDSIIGEENTINSSQITESVLGNKNQIGPNSYIRNNNEIGDNNKIGFCVEIKNSFIGNNNKIKHLSYIGDTILKSNVEIGAGTITANYDGIQKKQTIIESNAFIGCNVNLIAPVTIGENTLIAAGSTITEDVPTDALAIARNRQTNKKGYNKKNLV